MNLSIKKTKIIIFFVLILFVVLKFFNTPYNLYSILNFSHEKRMAQNYGFCEKECWGFYNLVSKKFSLEKDEINLINDQGFVTPERLFGKIKSNLKNVKYFMILNFQNINDKSTFEKKFGFLKNYEIIYQYNNCYLLELND